MRMRLLAVLATVCATVNVAPLPAGAAALPGVACTSLVAVCVGGCSAGQLVRVQLIGDGYGEARCGSAVSYCYSGGLLGCSQAQMTLTSTSWIRCLADPANGPSIAICTLGEPID